MINLSDSKITDLLPSAVAEAKQIKALAYAVSQQIQTICTYADNARIYAEMATVPEAVLDYLAVELRTPAYDESYSLAIKRTLVMETLTFYMKMGTPSAVNKIIETIFETGYISEWWEYGGDPYHFKAITTNPAITADDVDEFERVLSSVKRLSAHLDEIILDLSVPTAVTYQGVWVHTGTYHTLQPATL